MIRNSLAIAIAIGVATAAWGFDIEPGMWKTTTTSTSPMMPQGKTETQTKCVTQEEAKGDFLAALGGNNSPCKISDRKESGDTLEFTMDCPNQMGSAKGKGRFTSKGDSGSGKMEMTMSFEGRTMKIENTFESKRLGPLQVITGTAMRLTARRFLVAAAVMAVAGVALASDVPDFVAACTSSSNLEAEICECAGAKAKGEMSAKAFDFLVASLKGDDATTEKLRPELAADEALKAGTFMLHGPAQCAREKSTK